MKRNPANRQGTSTADSLRAILDTFPHIPLAKYPTPLEHLPRLSQEIGKEVYVKRDDALGPAFGGNKTRKLEYLLADALELGAKKIATFGGLGSNHVRITAAAARKVGLEPHLFFFDSRPTCLRGNMFLNHLLGAKMHFIPLGRGGGGLRLETTIRLVKWLARMRLGSHYFIPVGGHSWRGALGYLRAALEIDEQARQLGIENARLVVAAGSGGTLSGLMAGLALIDSPIKLIGIDVGNLWKDFPVSISHLATILCTQLHQSRNFSYLDVPLIQDTYVGEKYAAPTTSGLSAIRKLAQLEGILLDPVYTAKAFAGMLDLIAKGQIGQGEPLIFLHTGGVPGLFALNVNRIFM